MSTTIKRVALVAVAALGLGVLSVAPSQAASQADSLTLSSATASQLTYETQTAGSAVATLAFLGADAGDTLSVSAYLVSAPAGNTVSPTLVVSDTANAVSSDAKPVVGKDAGTKLGQVAYVATVGTTKASSAKFIVYMDGPTVAGTYVVKLTPAVVGGGGVLNAASQTLTITVATNPAKDTVVSTATIIMNKGETITATSDDVVTHSKTVPVAGNTASAATFKVSLLNAAGAATSGESFTAYVSAGPGLLGSATWSAGGSTTENGASATGRAISVKAGDIVAIFPDGASGVSTVTFTSAAGVVLGTKSLTFYGTAASATAAVVKPIIKATSGQNAILVNLKDAAGTTITNATTFYVTSSDTTKISGAYTATASAIEYDLENGTLGAGYLIPLTGLAAGTSNITVGTKSSATATTGVEAAAVSVRVGSATPASVSVTTDKSSYAPGEKATITVVLKDATALELADSVQYANIFATGGIVASYTLGAGSDTTTATAVDAFASGKKTFTVYMPVTEGDVKFSWTTGTGLATANNGKDGSVTVSVSSVATSAAIDAANEAAQAASDATDAALAAADAADAATTKAQEAVDAVATLSAQVSKLITALKAQITTLTNLVIKIQKKVKA